MTTGRATRPGAPQDFAAVDRLLAAAVADGVAPGFVAMIANAAGVLHASCHGVHAINGTQAMTPDTVFWLASMTKLVTTIGVMQLVETGDLALDAPVAALLPELAHPRVLSGIDNVGRAVTRAARGAITLRQLLTHTSGIGYELMNMALLRGRGPDGPPPATKRASLEGPLATDPGDGWTYGYGIDWAGMMIERRSGLPLDHYFANRTFAPLGIRDTGFVVAPGAAGRVAATHLRSARGAITIIPSPAGAAEDWEFHSGGAGLFGTAVDYIRLLRMLLGGGELDGARLLRKDTVDMMWDNQIGDLPAGRLDTVDPALLLPYDPFPGQHGEWSLLGLRNRAPVANGRHAGSASWVGVGGTIFWVDRAADLCGVLLAQLFPFADPALSGVQRDVERAAYAATAPLRGNDLPGK